jgi:hypothetical protein
MRRSNWKDNASAKSFFDGCAADTAIYVRFKAWGGNMARTSVHGLQQH